MNISSWAMLDLTKFDKAVSSFVKHLSEQNSAFLQIASRDLRKFRFKICVVINISEPRQLLYFAFLFLRENFLSWILNNSDRNCLLEHVKYLIWQIERKRPNFQLWLLLAVLPLIYLIHNGLYPCPLPSEHKRRKDVGYHSLSRVRYLQKINNQSFNCLNTTPPPLKYFTPVLENVRQTLR